MNRDRIAMAVTRIEQATSIDEQARMAEVRAMGFVPAEVGPEIPMAPARWAGSDAGHDGIIPQRR